MTKIEGLQQQLRTMHDLEDLTNMLEQVAARDIAQMREQILQSRPFFQEFWTVYRVLKQLTPPPPQVVHKHLVVLIGIDWGMPGSLLNRVVKKSEELYHAHGADMLITGKMAQARFSSEDERTMHLFNAPKKASLSDVAPIYKVISQYAHVTFVYPKFETLSKQTVATASLSISDRNLEDANSIEQESGEKQIDVKRFIIEPDAQSLSNYMNETVVGLSVYHYFAESLLAYSAAQMVAMRNSYDNAKNESRLIQNRYHKAKRSMIDAKIRELYGSRIKTTIGVKKKHD